MKLMLQNTSRGLVPLYDEDYDSKKKLKIGEVYNCDVKMVRNYQFHKMYFALINCAWEFQNEAVIAHFKESINLFREAVEIAAGNTEQFYSIDRKEWIEKKKSISFEKMQQDEFNDLYDRVKDVLFSIFLKSISEDDFKDALSSF